MTAGPVRAERIGRVLALVLDAPPDNALGPEMRAGLAAALDMAGPETGAVVILAEGPHFAGEAFGAGPDLGDLCRRIEELSVPVVVALQGPARGGGAELALAAHYRVAAEGAALSFPSVARGLAPQAGATQRLPRLVGAAAVEALTTGRPLPAETPGLCDRVVPRAALAEAAVALAAAAAGPRPVADRRDGFRDLAAFRAALAAGRAAVADAPVAAPGRILDCIEAALLLPLPQGLAFETAAAEDLAARPEAAALGAAMRAEARAAAEARGAPGPKSLLILGAEGEGLAREALVAGLKVIMAEQTEETLRLALEAVAEGLSAEVAAGRIAPKAQAAAWARLTPALALAPGAETADLALLAGPWAEAGRAEGLGEVPVALLGRQGPGGLGFLPAMGGRLAEVLAGNAVPERHIALLLGLAGRLGRLPVLSRGKGIVAPLLSALGAAARHQAGRQGPAVTDGVLAGFGLKRAEPAVDPQVEARLYGALANAGLRLLGEGAALWPADIDLALVHGLGWHRHVPGPMLWAADRGALVLRADLARWAAEAPEIWTPAPILDRLIRDGLPLTALDDPSA